MSEERRTPSPAGKDPIGALLQVAGRRPTAPDPVVDRVWERTHEEWRRMVRRRRRRVWGRGVLGSLAAALAVVLWVGFFGDSAPEPSVPSIPVATVEVVAGDMPRLVDADETAAPQPIAEADDVFEGASLATGPTGGVALRMASGGSLRLGPSTAVRFLGGSDLDLERGILYLDGGVDGSSDVGVHTVLGVVRERGTQFEVRVLDGEVRVRVREGAVLVEREEPVVASAGLELRIDRRGDVSRRSISVSDESWRWILDLAPSFRLPGRTLGDFLGWIEREKGKQVVFSAPGEAERLSSIVLYGSVDGLRPDEALDAVLPTCGLTAIESDQGIEIR